MCNKKYEHRQAIRWNSFDDKIDSMARGIETNVLYCIVWLGRNYDDDDDWKRCKALEWGHVRCTFLLVLFASSLWSCPPIPIHPLLSTMWHLFKLAFLSHFISYLPLYHFFVFSNYFQHFLILIFYDDFSNLIIIDNIIINF